MSATGVIPARFAAGRFAGKALADIAGRPLLQHVFERARGAKSLRRVLIATDDARIAAVARGFGAEVAITRADHATGSDRVAEVAAGLDDEIVVDIQGDEPLLEGFVIDAAVAALEGDPDVALATVVHRADPGALDDPNRVKVALDRRGRALYFSRSRIPFARSSDLATPVWQHVGVYAYRRSFLLEFSKLPRGRLECTEELEQLRALEHGHAIRCAIVDGWHSSPVDVPDDVAAVEARLAASASRPEPAPITAAVGSEPVDG